jgi:hypothetical protein
MSVLLPEGENFHLEVPKLLSELALSLDIPLEELNQSIDSLNRVQQAIKQKKKVIAEEVLYAPLVAYVGEIMRSETNGSWKTRLEGSEGVKPYWCPWIIRPDGSYCSPLRPVINFLFKGYKNLSKLVRLELSESYWLCDEESPEECTDFEHIDLILVEPGESIFEIED